jgi:hypothetical protein
VGRGIVRSVLVGIAALVVACGPSVAAPVPAERQPHLDVATGLVLRLEDVAPGAIVTMDENLDASRISSIVGLAPDTADFAKLGFEGAYTREFSWDASTDHPRVLASVSLLFKDAASAHKVLSSIDRRTVASRIPTFSLGTQLGDEAIGFADEQTTTTDSGDRVESIIVVVFRHANALSMVFSDATTADADPLTVVALARRQLKLQLAVAPRGVPMAPDPKPLHVTTDKHVFASDLVLVVADLPAGMRLSADGAMSAADFASGDTDVEAGLYANRVQQTYARKFTRKPMFGKEPTAITSATAVFYDSAGAHRSFNDMSDSMSANDAVLLGRVSIGDEAVAYRFDQRADDATYIDLLFRQRNAIGLLEIRFEGDGFNPTLALTLADRQLAYALADVEMLKPFH